MLGQVVLRLQRNFAPYNHHRYDPLPPWILHSIVGAEEVANFGWAPLVPAAGGSGGGQAA